MQSLEYNGNLSVIVVRFTRFVNEMQESRNIVRRTQIAVNYNKEKLAFSGKQTNNFTSVHLRVNCLMQEFVEFFNPGVPGF